MKPKNDMPTWLVRDTFCIGDDGHVYWKADTWAHRSDIPKELHGEFYNAGG